MLISKVILLVAHNIIDYPPVHLLCRPEVHIVIFGVLAFGPVYQPVRVYLDDFALGQRVSVN